MEGLSSSIRWTLGITLVLYVVAAYGIGLVASRKIESQEDFLVAGRRLGLAQASATLLATWFGAGTMLAAADEVHASGLQAIALEPLGAGLCLIVAGLFFAKPMWEMKLLTLGDFFALRFGPRSELLSALAMIPTYLGWIAVQFIALAGMLESLFGLPLPLGIALVAILGTGYTWLGGMWAVTMTDLLQVVILLAGLVYLGVAILVEIGGDSLWGGFGVLADALPAEMLEPIPSESARELLAWSSVLVVSVLGNLPGQDLMQRIFASRSARIARRACFLSGGAYLLFGAIPVMVGLAGQLLLPEYEGSIMTAMTATFLSPFAVVIFVFALASAVFSTIDSAILSPSAVLSRNLLCKKFPDISELVLNRLSILAISTSSLAVAYVGEDAYGLLEAAYEIGLMSLFVPLAMGLHRRARSELPALLTMSVGLLVWALHLALGWESFFAPLGEWVGVQLPTALATVALNLALYLAANRGPTPAGS